MRDTLRIPLRLWPTLGAVAVLALLPLAALAIGQAFYVVFATRVLIYALIATSLNLLPLSQLDGGHILYAVFGRRQWKLALPLWLLLVAAGFLFPGWWLWALIVMLIGLRHPPVADEETPLGGGRIALALVALLMLVLCFMPVPLVWLPTRP